ncbi:MAG: hypothetical protein V3U11_03080, partial [Planctomycetota bacterium]
MAQGPPLGPESRQAPDFPWDRQFSPAAAWLASRGLRSCGPDPSHGTRTEALNITADGKLAIKQASLGV